MVCAPACTWQLRRHLRQEVVEAGAGARSCLEHTLHAVPCSRKYLRSWLSCGAISLACIAGAHLAAPPPPRTQAAKLRPRGRPQALERGRQQQRPPATGWLARVALCLHVPVSRGHRQLQGQGRCCLPRWLGVWGWLSSSGLPGEPMASSLCLSSRLARVAGPASGEACAGSGPPAQAASDRLKQARRTPEAAMASRSRRQLGQVLGAAPPVSHSVGRPFSAAPSQLGEELAADGGLMPAREPNILITGTPGTGKTATCQLVAQAAGLRHVNLGDRVQREELHSGWDAELECWVIDDDKVRCCSWPPPLLQRQPAAGADPAAAGVRRPGGRDDGGRQRAGPPRLRSVPGEVRRARRRPQGRWQAAQLSQTPVQPAGGSTWSSSCSATTASSMSGWRSGVRAPLSWHSASAHACMSSPWLHRGYSQAKLTANVECEIMQVVAEEACESYRWGGALAAASASPGPGCANPQVWAGLKAALGAGGRLCSCCPATLWRRWRATWSALCSGCTSTDSSTTSDPLLRSCSMQAARPCLQAQQT